jgi:hypothetical protein
MILAQTRRPATEPSSVPHTSTGLISVSCSPENCHRSFPLTSTLRSTATEDGLTLSPRRGNSRCGLREPWTGRKQKAGRRHSLPMNRSAELLLGPAMGNLRAEQELGAPMLRFRGTIRGFAPLNPWKTSNTQHPTSNLERPAACRRTGLGCWVFDVGGWMFRQVQGEGEGTKRNHRGCQILGCAHFYFVPFFPLPCGAGLSRNTLPYTLRMARRHSPSVCRKDSLSGKPHRTATR